MPQESVVTRQAAGPNFSWPHDEDGNPLALVTMQASELIGLPNYSNCTVGPASVTRFVKEVEIKQGLKECAHDVENIIAEERELVLETIKANAS